MWLEKKFRYESLSEKLQLFSLEWFVHFSYSLLFVWNCFLTTPLSTESIWQRQALCSRGRQHLHCGPTPEGRPSPNRYSRQMQIIPRNPVSSKFLRLGWYSGSFGLKIVDSKYPKLSFYPFSWHTPSTRSVRNCTSEQAVRTISKSNKLENEHLPKFTAIVTGNKCEEIFRSVMSAISTHRESLWLPIS